MPKVRIPQQLVQHTSIYVHAGQEWNGRETQRNERIVTKGYGQGKITQSRVVLLEEAVVRIGGREKERLKRKNSGQNFKHNPRQGVEEKSFYQLWVRGFSAGKRRKEKGGQHEVDLKNTSKKDIQVPSVINLLSFLQLQWVTVGFLRWRSLYQAVWHIKHASVSDNLKQFCRMYFLVVCVELRRGTGVGRRHWQDSDYLSVPNRKVAAFLRWAWREG